MTRLTIAILLVLLLLQGSLLAAPVPKDRKRDQDITNTTWVSDGETGFGPATYKFKEDGKIEYFYSNSNHTAGSWKQEGSQFSYELNGRYYWYEGEIQGDVIVGKAANKANGNWIYNLKRKYE